MTSSPLEAAMGCRINDGCMQMSTPEAAEAVSAAAELPLERDGLSISLPSAFEGLGAPTPVEQLAAVPMGFSSAALAAI